MLEPKPRTRPRVRSFASVEHLGPEAVAAYVDQELTERATHRARVHLVHCQECRSEVRRQHRAAEVLREGNRVQELRAPKSLLAKLAGIENSCPSGPGVEDSAGPQPESLLDKLDIMLRVVRRGQN
ncbi:zf-HC2 domain-containing protein [Corynebacterium halotolerans]|uniref:zf-HC2 domain-containing protein n=1 Tax=Corynebacterium halotolerans TaxID=225326 RepID=UPI003CF8219A